MSTDLSQFQESFFEELSEHLSTIEDGLLNLEQHPGDLDLLNRIFRAAHSIKGNSGMFGFTAVGQFTHKMETLLDQLRNGKLSVTPEIADILLRSTDTLKILIEAARGGPAPDTDTLQQLERELAAAAEGSSAPSGSHPSATPSAPATKDTGRLASGLHRFRIHWEAPSRLFQRGLDPVRMIGELEDLGTIVSRTLDTSRLPAFEFMDPEICYLSWTLHLETPKERAVVESVFDFVREESVLSIEEVSADTAPVAQPSASTAPSDPVEAKPLGEILVETGVVSRAWRRPSSSRPRRSAKS